MEAASRQISRRRRIAGWVGLLLAAFLLAQLAYVVIKANGRGPVSITGDLELVRSERPGLRVLFVGNSLTATYAMPAMVKKLAAGAPGASPIFPVVYWRGGSTLAEAAEDGKLAALLENEHWDYVVLQEQGQIPGWADKRGELMIPAAVELDRMARRAGAQTVLFMTWARAYGDPGNVPGDSYTTMQKRVDEGYREASAALGAPVAPVGHAWDLARRSWPSLQLWGVDGYHPTSAGSFLTAAVLYAVLARGDPVASRYTGGFEPAIARWLKRVARRTVRFYPPVPAGAEP